VPPGPAASRASRGGRTTLLADIHKGKRKSRQCEKIQTRLTIWPSERRQGEVLKARSIHRRGATKAHGNRILKTPRILGKTASQARESGPHQVGERLNILAHYSLRRIRRKEEPSLREPTHHTTGTGSLLQQKLRDGANSERRSNAASKRNKGQDASRVFQVRAQNAAARSSQTRPHKETT